jgi:hypothetical protein
MIASPDLVARVERDNGEATFEVLARDLRNYLTCVTKIKRQCEKQFNPEGRGLRYLSPEELVLFEATPIYARILDCQLPPMRAGNCFGNAFTVALQDRTMRYHEGWAQMEGSIPTHHAWLVDPSGAVHDPTWATVVQNPNKPLKPYNRNRCVYMGVHVPLEQHVGWFFEEANVNLLAAGEMIPKGLLEHGLDMFKDFDTGEAVSEETVADILRALEEHGSWELECEVTGIFRHTATGKRWDGRTHQFI